MKNLEIKATRTVVFTLQMTAPMALWLMGRMQNTPDDEVETEDARRFREELFTSLKESFDNVSRQ